MKKSISQIEKVYTTRGSHPVLVLCDDMEHYVVKYKQGGGITANNLYKEYLAAAFLKYWKLHVPTFELIQIEKEHIPLGLHPNIQPFYFDITCFGSKFSRNYSDITYFMSSFPRAWKEQFIYKNEILQIALFDAWLCNEDRNPNNPNLMYDLAKANRFVPIDHQYIFNSGRLRDGLSPLTFGDSILSFPPIKGLFKKKEVLNPRLLEGLKEKYYLCVGDCEKEVEYIFEKIPSDWNIPKPQYIEQLKKHLFSEEWIAATWRNYSLIFQQFVNQY